MLNAWLCERYRFFVLLLLLLWSSSLTVECWFLFAVAQKYKIRLRNILKIVRQNVYGAQCMLQTVCISQKWFQRARAVSFLCQLRCCRIPMMRMIASRNWRFPRASLVAQWKVNRLVVWMEIQNCCCSRWLRSLSRRLLLLLHPHSRPRNTVWHSFLSLNLEIWWNTDMQHFRDGTRVK